MKHKYTKNEILTHTNIIFDPLEILPEHVNIMDIAHSLSLITRANGHLKHFYSVAQHCVNCAQEAKNRGLGRRVQLACLLHDAAESYIADVPRPVKHRLTGYADIETNVLSVVFGKFGIGDLTADEIGAMEEIDDAMLYHEFIALKDTKIRKTEPYIAVEHDFTLRDMKDVEQDFIKLFEALTGEISD